VLEEFSLRIDGDAERAIIAYQSRISNMLNIQDMRERVMDCAMQGVGYGAIEVLLCCTLAHYEFDPQWVVIAEEARPDNERALRYLEWVEKTVATINRYASRIETIYGFPDPTRASDAVLISLAIIINYFESAPEAEKALRAKLGVPGERRKLKQEVAQSLAVGFFSYEMWRRFRDEDPHDDWVADLLRAAMIIISPDNVCRCRLAYLRLQYERDGR
jgi:hypothetical protein